MNKIVFFISMFLVIIITSSCTKTSGILGEPVPFEIGDQSTLSGRIIDSQTGQGLANATVSFTHDRTATTGANAEFQTRTDQNGNYTLVNLANGNYNMIVEINGYFTNIIENVDIQDGVNQIQPQTSVQQPNENSIRIVLTWGISPSDLDTHFTGPMVAGGRFHIYFNNKTTNGAGANLDVDDTSSYGPETLTIDTLTDGVYRYSVFNYTNQSTTGGADIKSSPAKVQIFDHSGLLHSFIAPSFTGNANTWRVFEMVVSETNITINAINTYIMASNSIDIASFVKNSTDSTSLGKRSNKKALNFNIAEW